MSVRPAPCVLLVEDEMLIAMVVEERLQQAGYHVVAAADLGDALQLACELPIDIAVLDINLAGSLSFPVADALRKRGIRFMFASGYGIDGLPSEYRTEAVLQKPYDSNTLLRSLAALQAQQPARNELAR